MQTIKTAIVVVLLLGVCYGAYVALNAPEPVLPPELEAWDPNAELMVEDGQAVSIDIPQLADHRPDLGTLSPPSLASAAVGHAGAPGANKSFGASSSLPELPPLRGLDDASLNSLGQPATTQTQPSKPGLGGLANADDPLEQSKDRGLNTQDLPGLSLPKVADSQEFEGVSVPLKPAGGGLPPVPGSLASLSGEGTFAEIPGFPTGDQGPMKLPTLSLPGANATATDAATSLNPATLPASGSANEGQPKRAPLAGTSKPTQPFKPARDEALKLANEGKLREALVKLSAYHNNIELTREEQADLNDLLDALAREVIYSKRHLIAPAFHVGPGETLEGLANRFKVSPETLASINMLGDSKVILTGSQLKVLNGPFRADVNLTRGELTLFLEDMYAGRFPISVGKEPIPMEGSYQIVDRRRDRTYYGANSQVLPATDARNPYGGYWMSLGQDLCIHGSPANAAVELANAGCISLAPLDAREVYSLLTLGSQVTIHR